MIRGGGIDTEPAEAGAGLRAGGTDVATARGCGRRTDCAGDAATARGCRRRTGCAGEVADVEAAGNNVADPAGDADEAGTGDDCARHGECPSQESSRATTSIDGLADRPIILVPLRDGYRGGMTYRPFR